MNKYIPAILWILAMYTGTALTAGQSTMPDLARASTAEQINQAWFWFEFDHVILHGAAYGVLVTLIIMPFLRRQNIQPYGMMAILMIIVLIVGLGQEIVQSLIRCQLGLAASLKDLIVNVSGAILTVGIFRLVSSRKSLPETYYHEYPTTQ